MDIVRILRDAIANLPKGDHSAGLSAIIRHIASAIRHFERSDGLDQDNFTDAIYRSNQAYEGSLKEAYRVLAGKDPSGKTPNQIEIYLESNNIVRPRVLVQLSRYRQDYRNPSTHDYKLDFDEDEALLAIVSVCAFAKLLVDQIAERLAFEEEKNNKNSPKNDLIFSNDQQFAVFVSKSITSYLAQGDDSTSYSAFEGGIAGHLTSIGLEADLNYFFGDDKDVEYWDILVKFNGFKIPIEIRGAGPTAEEKNFYMVHTMAPNMDIQNISIGLVILRNKSSEQYSLYETKFGEKMFYFISKFDTETMNDANDEECIFSLV